VYTAPRLLLRRPSALTGFTPIKSSSISFETLGLLFPRGISWICMAPGAGKSPVGGPSVWHSRPRPVRCVPAMHRAHVHSHRSSLSQFLFPTCSRLQCMLWVFAVAATGALALVATFKAPAFRSQFGGRCVPVVLPPTTVVPPTVPIPALADVLDSVRTSTGRCEVLLTFATDTYVSVVTNFLLTTRNVRPLTDVIVVGLTPGVCAPLTASYRSSGLQCVDYPVEKHAGDFGSAAFADLVNVKTEVALDAALLGYSVLLVDGDISFLRDPVPLLREGSNGIDLQIQVRAS
jgi:hypothetical protein